MSSSIGFCKKEKHFESNSIEDEDLLPNDYDEGIDSQRYLYEVPYTSSSVDRSSIGSIPWADDAIKINKTEWEKVEKMLCGLEPLTSAEEDLRNEILDWQKKFPQLLNKCKRINMESTSIDIDSLPSLDFTSDDEYYESEDKVTLTRPPQSFRKPSLEDSSNLSQLMDNFTLNPVPYKLTQREPNRLLYKERKCASSTSSYSLHSPPTPISKVPLITTSTNRFQMPPILNILDSKRKFRSMGQNKNHSFVQLTQVQQAKSAAEGRELNSRSRFLTSHRSAWNVPFAANRFSNNRNSIVLPSLSTKHQVNHRYSTQPTTTSTSSEVGKSNAIASTDRRTKNSLAHNITTNNHLYISGSRTNASTQTNTSNTTTSGRSISAVVKYPRLTNFNALYLPYSASKFHAFK